MRTVPAGMTPSNVREINGRAVIKKRLPAFEAGVEHTHEYYAHDAVIRGETVYRIASAYDGISQPVLFTQEITAAWARPLWTQTTIGLMPGSGISLTSSYIFMHKSNGDLVRRDIDTESETVFLTDADPLGIAAVSDTEVYIMQELTDSTYLVKLYNDLGLQSEWHGRIYGERNYPGAFDAERLDGKDYIVFETDNGQNARIINREGDIWSDSESIYPIDVVDDTSQFRLGALSIINDKLVIVGVITRSNYKVKVYTMGVEHLSHGREWFITEGEHIDYGLTVGEETLVFHGSPGKMLLFDDWLWVYTGDQSIHYAKSTVLFGTDRDDLKEEIGIETAQFNSQTNRPARINFNVPSQYGSELLAGGNLIEWYASVNGVEVKMGTFSIDAVFDIREPEGSGYSVVARSLGGKYLTSWNSDSSFDYWSQTKQVSNVAERSEVIQAGGTWKKIEPDGEEDYLIKKDFNIPGILYTVLRSSRNGEVEGEFKIDSDIQPDSNPKYGVAMAYYRETPQDAAQRLGEETATDYDCFNHGYFFVVDSATLVPYLYRVVDDEWTQIALGAPLTIGTGWHWLRIAFHEGNIRCDYRTGTDWVTAITHTLHSDVGYEKPWFQNDVGKGAIYVENITPHSESYQFGSQDEIIPVYDNSPFPASDIVIVDEEIMRYNAKSINRSPLGPLDWVDGKTYKGAPDDNVESTNTITTSLISRSETVSSNEDIGANWIVAQSFISPDHCTLDHISLYFSDIVTSDIEIRLCTDDYDNFDHIPTAAILATKTINPGASGWINISLGSITLQANDAYFIAIHGDGYNVHYGPDVNKSRHLCRVFDNSSASWQTLSRTLAYRVYARSGSNSVYDPNEGNGFEIYLDGEDLSSKGADYYDGCALVITEGPGAGQAYKITGYDYTAPYQWVPNDPDVDGWENFVGNTAYGSWVNQQYRRVFVNKKPSGVFTEDTKAMIVPSLRISERGIFFGGGGEELVDKSNIAAHPDSICSLYRDDYTAVRKFHYFSGERDWTLEQMIREITSKANAFDVYSEMRLEESGVGAGTSPDMTTALADALEGESAIVDFEVTNWNSGGVGLAVFPPEVGDYVDLADAAVVVEQNAVKLYKDSVLDESFPTSEAIEGMFTISFQRTNFSIYNNNKLVCHFDWAKQFEDDTTLHVGFKIGVVTSGLVEYNVRWSALDNRVDNYILDIGLTGYELINSLIGEKRVYYLDDQDGKLKLFRNFTPVNLGEPLDLHVTGAINDVDTNIRTRLRVEGAEVVETVDFEALKKYGNLFALIGLREPNNIVEAKREADLIREDLMRTKTGVPLEGGADPRIEAGDIVDFYYEDQVRSILVNSISYQMFTNEKSAIFDMNIDGVLYE